MKSDRVMRVEWLRWAGVIGVATAAIGCGKGAVGAGGAAGLVGRDLASQADEIPRGAEVCALEHALAAPAPGAEKPLGETCEKEARSEELWRRAMLALGAYTERLAAVAGGADPGASGALAAARTGIAEPEFVAVEEPAEVEARAAAAALVAELQSDKDEKDLDELVKTAKPHVETLCKGLDPYLDAELQKLDKIQQEVEKRRTTRSDRRCAMLDNRAICVGESAQDRLGQGLLYGELTGLTASYLDAKNSLSRFCAAHTALAAAAAKGKVKSSDTAAAVAEAVKGAKVTRSTEGGAPTEAPAEGDDAAAKAEGGATPSAK